MSHPEALAFAPATVANVAVGFDVLGHAFAGLGDRVRARPIAGDAVVVAAITGTDADRLPRDPEQNTAAAAVRSLLAEVRPDFGIELRIEKGIPLSSGLGGSAASAVAGVVAANALLPEPHPRAELYPHALAGEMVASGAAHGDNVGPALVGGLVLALADRVRSLPVPEGLWCAVACPDMALETRAARAALLAPYAIEEFVAQQRNFAV
ncbi:MAG: homoserine kinase, partial [Planctomycetes bacterium]|nr:homoserine kinase [Planctomycetota bacterium]